MNVKSLEILDEDIVYPDSDGKPMADNTKQFRWIITIAGGLQALFADNPDVFVAGDLLWYPVEGNNKLRAAPDAMVAFGRPKGDRGSYKQWEENNIAPQVVFEVLSPGNTTRELNNKFRFYERYGVQEYYLYDPDNGRLEGWQRAGDRLHPIERMPGWVSPRLGIRFEMDEEELRLYRPDGLRFTTYEETVQRAESAEQRIKDAEAELERLRALLKDRGIDS